MTVLIRDLSGDPNTQPNGRGGQAQAGVDISAVWNGGKQLGVQCKQKLDKAVTEDELKKEVANAKNFRPALQDFILVTTAPRDQKIQKIAREISKSSPFTVSVWGWEDIEERAASSVNAWKEFDPSWTPFVETGFQTMGLDLAELKGEIKKMAAAIAGAQHISNDSSTSIAIEVEHDEGTPRHGKISAYLELIKQGSIHVALTLIDTLETDEWEQMSPSERYRLSAARANAHLKLEDFPRASEALSMAYAACPTYKSAKRNEATNLIMQGKFDDALALAETLIADNPEDEDVIGILVQARDFSGDQDPFAGLNDEQKRLAVCLNVQIQILRSKGDAAWHAIARAAYAEYPDDKFVQRHYADAVLERAIREAPNLVAGQALSSGLNAEISDAAKLHANQLNFLIQNGGKISPAVAQNAAVAQRLVDDYEGAYVMTKAGWEQNPENGDLVTEMAFAALATDRLDEVVDLLAGRKLEHAQIGTLANAHLGQDNVIKAEEVLNDFDISSSDAQIVGNYLSLKFRIFVAQKQFDEAAAFFRDVVSHNIELARCASYELRAMLLAGKREEAAERLPDAVQGIDVSTSFQERYQLAIAAFQLDEYATVHQLLFDHVSKERGSDALWYLIAAAINGHFWRNAANIFESLSDELKKEKWVARAQLIYAVQTGSLHAKSIVRDYLNEFPSDAEIRLCQIGLWQLDGNETFIRKAIATADLENLEGFPHQIIHYYRAVVNFGRQAEGLKGAYKILLQNWQDMKCHLAFGSVFFTNDNFTDIELNPSTVGTNCVVTLQTSGGPKRVRIEDESLPAFGDERLSSSSDLATALIGKAVGDEINVGQGLAEQHYKIEAIKSVELDAFHASLEAFNTRFPNSNSMIKLSIDMDAEDPLAEMREITKQSVERDRSILDMYRDNGMPLAFLAALLGKDILECWAGLGSEGIPFKCSRGIAAERESALQILSATDPMGVVVDTVTLNIIYKVGALDAVNAACGALKIAQSTLDLLAHRVLEARQAKGKQKGFMAWHENRLVLTEITDADWDQIIEYRQAMLDWTRKNTDVLPSVPLTELTGQVRDVVNVVGIEVATPAIAAQNSGLLMLSDDFRFREWAAEEFGISTTWLQPVLMTALSKDALTSEEYCAMVNTLALLGHDYVSLNSQCLSQKFREDAFEISSDITKLLNILGGSNADLASNLFVASNVIDGIWQEPCAHHQKLRLIGEIMRIFTASRWEHADMLWRYLVKGCREMQTVLITYFHRWMVGHSLGNPKFHEIRQKYRE